jgi:hypothetical protein
VRVDDVRYAKTHLFPRLFAVELGITDFSRELSEAELALLLCVEHFDSHGVAIADIAGMLRWIGKHIAKCALSGGPLALITLLDYQQVVCSFIKDEGFEFGGKGVVSMTDVIARGRRSVSTAFCVAGIYERWQRVSSVASTTQSTADRAGAIRAAASSPPSAP